MITLVLFSVVLLVFLAMTGRAPSPVHVALYAVYQIHYIAIVAGFSLAASVLFMQYRDLNQVWEVMTPGRLLRRADHLSPGDPA